MKTFVIILLSLFLIAVSFAQVPQLINYQGKLDSAGVPLNGTRDLTFKIYDVLTGGTAIWTETQTGATITNGVFNVILGSVSPFSPSVFVGAFDRYIGITVGSGTEMTPRLQITSVAFSLRSEIADGVIDNSITGAKIVDGTIGAADIAANAVGTVQIADGAVAAADLASNSVTSPKIVDGTITTTDIAAGQVVTALNSLKDNVTLAAGTNVTITPSGNTLTIAAAGGGGGGTVTSVGAGTPSAGSGSSGLTFSANPITSTGTIAVANNGITSAMILDGTIAAADLASNSVTTVKIADNNVTAAKIADEPGIASNHYTGGITLNSTSMIDLTTVTITIPSAGYIVLYGKCYVHFYGVTTQNTALIQIDETAGGTWTIPYYQYLGDDVYSSASATYRLPFNVTRIFSKAAGTYTFRLEGMEYNASPATAIVYYPMIHAIYIPTAYGTVTTSAESQSGNPNPSPASEPK